MKTFIFFVLIVAYTSPAKSQTKCAEVRDRHNAALKAISNYQSIGSPAENDFDQLNAAYTSFRDYAVKAAGTETDYDVKLLLQITALQKTIQFLGITIRLNKFDLAWKEMKYCYDNIYSVINYQKLNRKDNFISCSLPENKQLTLNESDYHDICTDFICYCCNIVLHFKQDETAQFIFAKAGFKGFLTHGSLLHSIAGDLLIKRIDKGQLDDTTYLIAYKFLMTNNELQSMATISSDFANMTYAKALDVMTNPALIARGNVSPVKDMDEFEKISFRYDHLYGYLSKDSGFKFSKKFELLRIALSDYLAEIRSIKITNHSFFQLPELYNLLDETFEVPGAKKELQEILNSGNTEMLSLLAQAYELYGEHCYRYYPTGFEAHYYYSAYLCYRAIGETKKANKTFNNIPKSMRSNKAGYYKKLE